MGAPPGRRLCLACGIKQQKLVKYDDPDGISNRVIFYLQGKACFHYSVCDFWAYGFCEKYTGDGLRLVKIHAVNGSGTAGIFRDMIVPDRAEMLYHYNDTFYQQYAAITRNELGTVGPTTWAPAPILPFWNRYWAKP